MTNQRYKDGTHHIYQTIQAALIPFHQLRGIMLLPLLPVLLPKVPFECFLAPGAIDGVGNGCKRGHRFVFGGVFEELELSEKHGTTISITIPTLLRGLKKLSSFYRLLLQTMQNP